MSAKAPRGTGASGYIRERWRTQDQLVRASVVASLASSTLRVQLFLASLWDDVGACRVDGCRSGRAKQLEVVNAWISEDIDDAFSNGAAASDADDWSSSASRGTYGSGVTTRSSSPMAR